MWYLFLGPGPGFSKRSSEMGRKASQGPPANFRAPRGPTGWEAFSIISGQAGNIATTLLSLVIIANQTSNAN